MKEKILKSLNKFKLNLDGKTVLTEAASGNYAVTPVIAAKSGATVFALFKESKFGTYDEVLKQIFDLAKELNIRDSIFIIKSYNEIDLSKIDILTNTGFNRPINKIIIDRLSPNCVIPLMWEPWEFRPDELDIDYCAKKGIKVYGTNESDNRLKTMNFIGYIVLYFLLRERRSPYSTSVLILGNKHFSIPIVKILEQNNYTVNYLNKYEKEIVLADYDSIVFAEHLNNQLLLGDNGFVKPKDLNIKHLIIHIAGNINSEKLNCKIIPDKPAKFGYMSFTTDFIDSMALIDLHTAGLKVGEGMLKAKQNGLLNKEFKDFIENNYPALAFENEKYW